MRELAGHGWISYTPEGVAVEIGSNSVNKQRVLPAVFPVLSAVIITLEDTMGLSSDDPRRH